MLQHLWSTGWSSEVFQVLDSTDAESVEQKLVSISWMETDHVWWSCVKRMEEQHENNNTVQKGKSYTQNNPQLFFKGGIWKKLLERGEISTIVCQSSSAPGLMAMWFWWAMRCIQWCPIWGRAVAKPLRTVGISQMLWYLDTKRCTFAYFSWIDTQILDKLWNFDREMIFDERSHPKMCHAMWGCLRAHTHLICQQNLRRRLWSKGGWDFFNSAQPPVKDQTVWINDYSSTIAPSEDYLPKLLGVSRSQKYHFRVGAFRSEWLNHHGIFQTWRWPPRHCRTSTSRVCHGWPGFPCSRGWLPIWSSMLGDPSCCGWADPRCFDEKQFDFQWSMIGSFWWEEVP